MSENNKMEYPENHVDCVKSIFVADKSTRYLFNHYSTITAVADTMDNYSRTCLDQKHWYTKRECNIGKKATPAGWKSVMTKACKDMLQPLNLWKDSFSIAGMKKVIEIHEISLLDTEKKRMITFYNALFFSRLSVFKAEYLADEEQERQDAIAEAKELEKTDEPATDEPATDEPATDEPATDEPATDEPVFQSENVLSENVMDLLLTISGSLHGVKGTDTKKSMFDTIKDSKELVTKILEIVEMKNND